MGLRSAISLVFSAWIATSCLPGHAAEMRPVGRNCELVQPPADAGEDGGHGYVVLVYPRTVDLEHDYTGCQAIFSKSGNQPARLAWLVEVRGGDAIRVWSDNREMADLASCRYSRGELVRGDSDKCLRGKSLLLLPSQPAGCFTVPTRSANCTYDRE